MTNELIVGNNLKMEVVVPYTIDSNGDGYTKILYKGLPASEYFKKQVVEEYRYCCITLITTNEFNFSTGKIKKVVLQRGKRVGDMRFNTDMSVRGAVTEMRMMSNKMKNTNILINRLRENVRNRFVSQTIIKKNYNLLVMSPGRKHRARRVFTFEYPAYVINESFKTFLLSMPAQEKIIDPYSINWMGSTEYKYLLEDTVGELDTVFKNVNMNGDDWDTYIDKEVKRLLEVTASGKLPDSKM